jgi:hypothetical protein
MIWALGGMQLYCSKPERRLQHLLGDGLWLRRSRAWIGRSRALHHGDSLTALPCQGKLFESILIVLVFLANGPESRIFH